MRMDGYGVNSQPRLVELVDVYYQRRLLAGT